MIHDLLCRFGMTLGDPVMNTSKSSMSFCLLYVNNIYFYMCFESASQSNMSVKFDIGGSPDEFV